MTSSRRWCVTKAAQTLRSDAHFTILPYPREEPIFWDKAALCTATSSAAVLEVEPPAAVGMVLPQKMGCFAVSIGCAWLLGFLGIVSYHERGMLLEMEHRAVVAAESYTTKVSCRGFVGAGPS